MKLIIAGGRDYFPTFTEYKNIRKLVASNNPSEIVSGKNKTVSYVKRHDRTIKVIRGGDYIGERIAKRLNIPVTGFPANWNEYGRAAGPIRNKEMAEYADAVILLPGGNGTANMRRNAITYQLNVMYDFMMISMEGR